MYRILVSTLLFACAAVAGCADEPAHHRASAFGPANLTGDMSPGTGVRSLSGTEGWHAASPSFRAARADQLPDTAVQNPDGTFTYQGMVYRRK